MTGSQTPVLLSVTYISKSEIDITGGLTWSLAPSPARAHSILVSGSLWGNPLVTGGSPYKGQRRWALVFSLIRAWTNGWVNNRDTGDPRRHHSHYDVTLMGYWGYRLWNPQLWTNALWSISRHWSLGHNVSNVYQMLSYDRTGHIDVVWTCWRHQTETFSALLDICAWIHRSPVNSRHKGQWRGALMCSLICAWDWWFETPLRPLWRPGNEIDEQTVSFFVGETSTSFIFQSTSIYQSHKAHTTPLLDPTMHRTEQKCARFCSAWCIVGYGTGVLRGFVN